MFASQPRTVEVVAIGGDKQKDEIYHPSAVSFPRWIWVALGFVSLVLALAGIWWIKKWADRRKARVENLARAHRVLNPQEEFEKRRGDIELEKFLENGKFKQHYFALSDSSKSFLGAFISI